MRMIGPRHFEDDGVATFPDYWPWDRSLDGLTVVVVGSGPSLADVDLQKLAGQRLIAINSACRAVQDIATEEDILYFADNSWNENHPDAAEAWPGIIITCNRYAAARLAPRALRLDVTALTEEVRVYPDATHASSGHTATALAAAMGAKRAVLVGFDGGPVEGQSHSHSDYREADATVYTERFLPGWEDLIPGLARMGCEVVNIAPDSAIRAAAKMSLEEALGLEAQGEEHDEPDAGKGEAEQLPPADGSKPLPPVKRAPRGGRRK